MKEHTTISTGAEKWGYAEVKMEAVRQKVDIDERIVNVRKHDLTSNIQGGIIIKSNHREKSLRVCMQHVVHVGPLMREGRVSRT